MPIKEDFFLIRISLKKYVYNLLVHSLSTKFCIRPKQSFINVTLELSKLSSKCIVVNKVPSMSLIYSPKYSTKILKLKIYAKVI